MCFVKRDFFILKELFRVGEKRFFLKKRNKSYSIRNYCKKFFLKKIKREEVFFRYLICQEEIDIFDQIKYILKEDFFNDKKYYK